MPTGYRWLEKMKSFETKPQVLLASRSGESSIPTLAIVASRTSKAKEGTQVSIKKGDAKLRVERAFRGQTNRPGANP